MSASTSSGTRLTTSVAQPFRAALTVALILVAIPTTPAQQPTPQRAGSIDAGVTAVLVDVVVRDRRGEPVRDLKQSDFQVIEDGVPQALGSFTPVFDVLCPAMTR